VLGVVAVIAVLVGCGSRAVSGIDVPGYPTCLPGTGGDLRVDVPAALTLTVEPEATAQRMVGFGASDCWSIQHVGEWPLEQRSAIADLLFADGLDPRNDPLGIALSVWRFSIGAGSSRQGGFGRLWRDADAFYNDDFTGYDWNRLQGQRWFLQAAKARGVDRFIAFVNSPPVNLTKNGLAYCNGETGSTNLAEGREDEYAAYLAAIVTHFREAEQISFDVISPFNEPQWAWDAGTQEGCRYSAGDIRRVVDVLHAETSLGETEIEIPESGAIVDLWSGENYIEAFFRPDSPSYVGDKVAPTVTAHSYKTDLPATGLVERRRELREALDRHPGLGYSMTEYCPLGPHGNGRDLGMDTALMVARVVHFDVVVAGATSWQWWLAVSPYDYKDGLLYVDPDHPAGEILQSKTLWALGNFSRFIRPGMVRVGVTRSDGAADEDTAEGLMVSGFHDRVRGIVAMVAINWSEQPAPVEIEARHLPVDEWIPYLTNGASDLKACAAIPAGEAIGVPARSVVTLVGHRALSMAHAGKRQRTPAQVGPRRTGRLS
jgi:O-glycosyl hydrolase